MNKKKLKSLILNFGILAVVVVYFYYRGAASGPASDINSKQTNSSQQGLDQNSIHEVTVMPLVLCSQNLNRIGSRSRSNHDYKTQLNYILDRFEEANCDVLALQEIVGNKKSASLGILRNISDAIYAKFSRKYDFFVGESNDSSIRNGFLFDSKKVKLLEKKEFHDFRLERMSPIARGARFTRGPLGALFEYNQNKLFILNVHFKSKSKGWKDSLGTDFEVLRMEMAKAARDISQKYSQKFNALPIIVGDFNSAADSATSDILEGKRELYHFRTAKCEVDSDYQSKCKEPANTSSYVGLLETKNKLSFRNHYTYRYKGEKDIIDEMYIRKEDLKFFSNEKFPNIISIGKYGRGSDHLLIRAEIRL